MSAERGSKNSSSFIVHPSSFQKLQNHAREFVGRMVVDGMRRAFDDDQLACGQMFAYFFRPTLRDNRVMLPAHDEFGLSHAGQSLLKLILNRIAKCHRRSSKTGSQIIQQRDEAQRHTLTRDIKQEPQE